MNIEREEAVLQVEIEDYRFINLLDEIKDIEVYKKSTVKEGEYIFVQTIRLMKFEAKYMINSVNLEICAREWYDTYIKK